MASVNVSSDLLILSNETFVCNITEFELNATRGLMLPGQNNLTCDSLLYVSYLQFLNLSFDSRFLCLVSLNLNNFSKVFHTHF